MLGGRLGKPRPKQHELEHENRGQHPDLPNDTAIRTFAIHGRFRNDLGELPRQSRCKKRGLQMRISVGGRE